MKLKIRNIGKIKDADITLDGITVLTGENNTGKSTIGKVLYCLFKTFKNADAKVQKQKRDSLVKTINKAAESKIGRGFRAIFSDNEELYKAIEQFVDQIDFYQYDEEFKPKLSHVLEEEDIRLTQEELQQLYRSYKEVADLSNNDVLTQMLGHQIQSEFGTSDIVSINTKNNAGIDLRIKDGNISINNREKNGLAVNEYINLLKTIIYIDDPFVLDHLGNQLDSGDVINHRQSLIRQLTFKTEHASAVDELIAQKKLRNIMDKIQSVSDGNLVQSESGNYLYQSQLINGSIPVEEVSTGIKSFMILKQLLLNGQLEENGIVVLDEPEVHLHPQWQILFSEIVVLLSKEFHINFLITTHSIDFLSAIEYYSKIYEIDGMCDYYMMEKEEFGVIAKETSGHLDHVYAKLSEPFIELTQKLENL